MQEILRSVAERPNDKSQWLTSLGKIQQLSHTNTQAESLAELASLVMSTSKVRGLEFILSAFRLAPENEQVLKNLLDIVVNLELLEAVADVEKWRATLANRRRDLQKVRSLFEDPVVTTIAKAQVNRVIPNDVPESFALDTNVTRVNWVNDVQTETVDEELQNSKPLEVQISFSPVYDDEIFHEQAPSPEKSKEIDVHTHAQTFASEPQFIQPHNVPRDTFVGRVQRGRPYEIFRLFLKESGIVGSALECAEEFQDSLVGFIHFLHYLKAASRIDQRQFEKCAAVLGDHLQEKVGEFKAQLRFAELIEPLL